MMSSDYSTVCRSISSIVRTIFIGSFCSVSAYFLVHSFCCCSLLCWDFVLTRRRRWRSQDWFTVEIFWNERVKHAWFMIHANPCDFTGSFIFYPYISVYISLYILFIHIILLWMCGSSVWDKDWGDDCPVQEVLGYLFHLPHFLMSFPLFFQGYFYFR